MPLGGMSFHDYDLIHGSFPNTSDIDRCAISLGLMTEEAQIDGNVEDYGYALVLDDERFCPTIYRT
jgi:ectoine hydroxylase-related dioxygenase (phytanoyl-CoA dioxygenase family)